jgi:hypothetical protein
LLILFCVCSLIWFVSGGGFGLVKYINVYK